MIRYVVGLGIVVIMTAIAIGAALSYDFFPRRVSEVPGTIVSFQNITTETGTGRWATVRLDSGDVVHAKYDGFIAVRSGQRIMATEVETRVFGLLHYRFNRHLGPHAGAEAAVVERPLK